MLVEDYLRPAAVKVGVKKVEDDSFRFGFHNLRHALSSYLQIQAKVDPKVVQKILRHEDINTTMNLHTCHGQRSYRGAGSDAGKGHPETRIGFGAVITGAKPGARKLRIGITERK